MEGFQKNQAGEQNTDYPNSPVTGRRLSLQAMQALNEFRLNNMLCDGLIKLEDESEFPVHRAIVSACSPFFRASFTTTLHASEKTSVLVKGVSRSHMESVLEYAYLRQCKVTDENVIQLLVTADYLCVMGIINMCSDYIINNLMPEHCIDVFMFSRAHNFSHLMKETHRYIMRNFVSIAQRSVQILDLPVEDIKEIIGSDFLNVKNEEVVWHLVLRWINHNPEERRIHIVDLMRKIRLGLLETQFFLENVKDHPYVTGNESCRPLIIDTLRFLYDLETIHSNPNEVATPVIARPRIPHEILFAIGGWSGGSPTNFIESYDTRADRWVKVQEVDPMGPRSYHGTAVIGFCIYVVGGFDGIDYFNSCRRFDATDKTWSEVAPMNARRCYVSVTTHDDFIYAMGGFDGHIRQNTAERYNYKTNQWSLIASMNAQRSDACATTLNGKIYITGGFNGQECLDTAEVYDPATNQWSLITQMRSRRSGVSCIAYHGLLYVIGGFNGISRMRSGEKYNPESNVWVSVPDMYNPRSNFAIEMIDDMIFAIGGFNGVTTIYHVECYDDKTNEWYEATDMNIYRSALSACVIFGLPNVEDYIHQHRDRLMEERRQRLMSVPESQRNQRLALNIHDDHNEDEEEENEEEEEFVDGQNNENEHAQVGHDHDDHDGANQNVHVLPANNN